MDNCTKRMINMIKIGEKITFKHCAKRGYGTCDRLYIEIDSKTHRAVDIGEAWNEYQHSVHPVDGEFVKIADYLKTIPVNIVEIFMDKYAEYSCCTLYPLFTFEEMRAAIDNIAEQVREI